MIIGTVTALPVLMVRPTENDSHDSIRRDRAIRWYLLLAVDIQDWQEKQAFKENNRLRAGLKLECPHNESKGRYELRQIDLESHQARF